MAEGDTWFEKLKIKSEDDSFSEEKHSHTFTLKFHHSEKTFSIHCDRPQTVLEAIQSRVNLQQELKCDVQSLVLYITDVDRKALQDIAFTTHFPCSCLNKEEEVTVRKTPEQVEERGTFDRSVSHSQRYYTVFIETKGGINAKSKPLFKSPYLKKFDQLLIYGTEDMTIRDAIARDGRFKELGDFKLEDVSKEKHYVFSSDEIQIHKEKTFRICFEKSTKGKENIKAEKQIPMQKAGEMSQAQAQDTSVQPQGSAQVQVLYLPKVVRIRDVFKRREEKGEDLQEIYQLLRDQFSDLKKRMLQRFPGNTFEETLEKVDFGKAQRSFSDVWRLEMLLKFGKSVCKLAVGNACVGTAFVLFENYILTNAHLFKDVVHHNILDPDVKVTALFNYKKAEEKTLNFEVHNMIDFDAAQDYAVLELKVSDENKVPPGLMKLFVPIPESGEACIIGHPGGDVQNIDPTCIIEMKSRIKEVNKHLQRFEDNMFAHMSVCHEINKQGIDRILSQSDPLSQAVGSYHTFMYHGSSGSPAFNGQCRIFGLHSGGFVYGLPPKIDSVIEFSHPVLLIFEKFVTNLKKSNREDLLELVKKHSKKNFHLKKILGSENLVEEPMDMS